MPRSTDDEILVSKANKRVRFSWTDCISPSHQEVDQLSSRESVSIRTGRTMRYIYLVFQDVWVLSVPNQMRQQGRIFLRLRIGLSRDFLFSRHQCRVHQRLRKGVYNLTQRLDFVLPKFPKRPLGAIIGTKERAELSFSERLDKRRRWMSVECAWIFFSLRGRIRDAGQEGSNIVPEEKFGGRVESEARYKILIEYISGKLVYNMWLESYLEIHWVSFGQTLLCI